MATKERASTRDLLLDIRNTLRKIISKEGAAVTLILLILASVIGFIIQDQIQKQRYLELLQFELNSNVINANIEVKSVLNKKYILNHSSFSTAVFNAGLQQGYLLTLNPTVMGQLYELYTTYLPEMNWLMNHDMDIINSYEMKWEECEDNAIINGTTKDQCSLEHQQYLAIQKQYSIYIAQDDLMVTKQISTIKFNPTQERLYPKNPVSFILRVLMGPDSLKVQQ